MADFDSWDAVAAGPASPALGWVYESAWPGPRGRRDAPPHGWRGGQGTNGEQVDQGQDAGGLAEHRFDQTLAAPDRLGGSPDRGMLVEVVELPVVADVDVWHLGHARQPGCCRRGGAGDSAVMVDRSHAHDLEALRPARGRRVGVRLVPRAGHADALQRLLRDTDGLELLAPGLVGGAAELSFISPASRLKKDPASID
jgi:hypothetical protein